MTDFKNEQVWLMQGDCLERMKEIPDRSVDLVLCDPPYGTTACKWDSVIDLELMWEQLKRIIKPNGAVVLFGSEPFSSYLRLSNIKEYKYDWYWRKSRPSGFVNAKLKPLKDIENIHVFSSGKTANGSSNNMPYYPQGLMEVNKTWKRPSRYGDGKGVNTSRESHSLDRVIKYENYPRQILDYSIHNVGTIHPTQKPIALVEYLIKTYTNECETVLDFTMGSGSTIKASLNLNRKTIGIEIGKCEKKGHKYEDMEWTDVLIDELKLE
jgi:site-specific DNA-methyltransferase (adenine-specific)